MYAYSLCDFRVDYRLELLSPLHVGGGARRLAARRGRAQRAARKSRGEDYAVSIGEAKTARGETSEVTLPIYEELRPDGQSSNGEPVLHFYVPGTSLRGVLRHYLGRRIDRAVRDIEVDASFSRDVPNGEMVKDRVYGDPQLPVYWEPRFGNVLVRQLFGSEARAGAVAFSRVELEQPRETPRKVDGRYSRTRKPIEGAKLNANLRYLTQNRLDRFTMASTEGLRTLAALEAGTILRCNVTVRNFSWWQIGALYLAFDALSKGRIRLGARGAVGLGRVKAEPELVVVRWHPSVLPKSSDRLPGYGACLESPIMAHVRSDDVLRPKVLGSDGSVQMYVHDPDDRIESPRADSDQAVKQRASFLHGSRAWARAGAEVLMRAATARLAAVAGGLGQRKEPPNE